MLLKLAGGVEALPTDGLVALLAAYQLDLLRLHCSPREGRLLAAVDADCRQLYHLLCQRHEGKDLIERLPLEGSIQCCDYDHDSLVRQSLRHLNDIWEELSLIDGHHVVLLQSRVNFLQSRSLDRLLGQS